MSSNGQRMVETCDAIANAPAKDYGAGQIIVDLATGKVYVKFNTAWVLIGSQT